MRATKGTRQNNENLKVHRCQLLPSVPRVSSNDVNRIKWAGANSVLFIPVLCRLSTHCLIPTVFPLFASCYSPDSANLYNRTWRHRCKQHGHDWRHTSLWSETPLSLIIRDSAEGGPSIRRVNMVYGVCLCENVCSRIKQANTKKIVCRSKLFPSHFQSKHRKAKGAERDLGGLHT